MQKIIAAMLGLLSITGTLYAQTGVVFSNTKGTPDERLFNLPPFSIRDEYRIELGKGNAMRLELADEADLSRFENIDSLLLLFLGDMKAFQDSLADPLTTKHIDYLIDTSGQKKLRIRQTRPAASTFLLDGSEPARLRLEQDTIYILVASPAARSSSGKAPRGRRYDRLGFFLNRYSELESYITSGLNRKIQLIQKSKHKNYSWNVKNGRDYMVADPSVSVKNHDRDRLEIYGFVAAQNYKNYFAPSFSLGASVHISKGFIAQGYNTNVYGVYWEPVFLFAPNAQGRLQTYRNDFLVARFAFARNDESGKEDGSNAGFGFGTSFSLAYLIGRQGSLVEPHTFRLTLGSLKALKGGLHLDPCLYFNDFFKGVTPGIRLSLGGF